jgi:DNA mismatch repair protein MutL
MEIRVLPSNIANMIAAGEVVQRPASAVKELMENAVDAGATQVSVIVKDAGRTLIQVIDNGCGMTPDQAVLSFERHATSKIATAEDLNNITTYGFRGEALASIAAVSEVTLRTRTADSQTGCQIELSDSKKISQEEVQAPVGSNFAVRNLFYNVPARRKFLKSDNVELKHIVEEFTKVALTHPEIGFSLSSNGKDIYVLQKANSLKFRIQDLLGTSAAGEIVDIATETAVVKIHGYIGRPESSRKTLGNQFFFVNRRYFRSPYFHKAVMKAYENLIPEGVTPSYFIYMEVDPHNIDVNIHPTKNEVKFQDDSVIFQILFACVRESLGKNSFGAEIDFDREGVPEMPVIGKDFDKFRPDLTAPSIDYDPTYNPFESSGMSTRETWKKGLDIGDGKEFDTPSGTSYDPSRAVDRRQDYGKLFEDKTLPTTQVIILQGRYIVSQGPAGLIAVNIQRARERILYERFLEAEQKRGHVSQNSLFPVRINVGTANRLVFTENAELLSSLGFEIAPAGTDSIVVSGVPEGYSSSQDKVEAAISDLLVALTENANTVPEMMASEVAAKAASAGARASEPMTSPIEAQRLMDLLFATENPEFTPSGKKIMAIIPIEEIDKKF